MSKKYRGSATPLPNIPHRDLVDLIRFYSEISREGMTSICRNATGDDKLMWDLQGGRRVGKPVRAQILGYITSKMLEYDDALNKLEALLKSARKAA